MSIGEHFLIELEFDLWNARDMHGSVKSSLSVAAVVDTFLCGVFCLPEQGLEMLEMLNKTRRKKFDIFICQKSQLNLLSASVKVLGE